MICFLQVDPVVSAALRIGEVEREFEPSLLGVANMHASVCGVTVGEVYEKGIKWRASGLNKYSVAHVACLPYWLRGRES